MEVKLLDFGQLASTSGGTESAPIDASSNTLGTGETPGFDNVLAIQLGALVESFVSRENGFEDFEGVIHSFLEEGGIISPLPAEFYRQPPNHDGVELFFSPVNFSIPQTENPNESLDLPITSRLPSGYKPQLSLEPISNPETLLAKNLSVVTNEFKSVAGKFLDTVIESAGFNRENISGNAPLPENKIHIASLSKPLGQANWNQEFGDRIIWLINKSHSSAELRLTPPNLGTIEVKIQTLRDQASIAFSSQNAQVREVLESAIPRLREMLGAQQIQLNDVFVDQHSFSRRSEADSNRQFSGEKFTDSPAGNVVENIETGDDIREESILTSEGVLSLYV